MKDSISKNPSRIETKTYQNTFMSKKIRVMFSVNGHVVGKPIEISDEDYIQYMIGQRDGNNFAMAMFVSGKFMKNQPVSPNSVSMDKAVGTPMWVFEIDRAIENHEDLKLYEDIDGHPYGVPEFNDGNGIDMSSLQPPEPEEPAKLNAIDWFIFKYIPKWENIDKMTRQVCYAFIIGITVICILAPSMDSSKKSHSNFKYKIQKIKYDATSIFD